MTTLVAAPERTIYILPSGDGRSCACSSFLPSKASADILDYYIDFTSWLASTQDSLTAITSASVTTLQNDEYDLDIESQTLINSSQVQLFLGYGHSGVTESIDLLVETVQGRSLLASMSIYIDACSPSAPDTSGQIITVNGQGIAVNGAAITAG